VHARLIKFVQAATTTASVAGPADVKIELTASHAKGTVAGLDQRVPCEGWTLAKIAGVFARQKEDV